MGVISEFEEFLSEYKVMGLAIAFMIGSALTTLTQSFVNNLIMPVVGIFLPQGAWQTATVNIGSATVGWGAFTSVLINFIILAFIVFLLSKVLSNGKRPARKPVRGRKRARNGKL